MTDTAIRTTGDEEFLGEAITASGLASDGPVRIPVERYTSPEFAARELEHLWPKVWHVACSVDHVAEPGDWYEHRVGPYSVLIVRGDDGELRAFQNACRHRGNPLCSGSGQGITELRCPFHRWAWDLRGQLREVPSRKGFGGLRNDDFPLIDARVDTWARFVFVNLDVDAEPLDEFLEGIPADIAWIGLDDFRCTFTTRTAVPCNWKAVNEGFSETYHVQGLHREMLASMDDINSGQHLWERHGVSYQDYGVPSPRLGRNVDDAVVWRSYIETQGGRMGPDLTPDTPLPEIPDGQTLQDVMAERIRAHQATNGVDLSRFDTKAMLGMSQYNLFPNITILVSPDLCTLLTARPGPTPDEADFLTLHFQRVPSADSPRTTPTDVEVPIEQAQFGFVLNQDFSVIKTIQTGLKQPGLTHLVLSNEECRIINMHRNLERVLGLAPGE